MEPVSSVVQIVSTITAIVASAIALYVSYRIATLKSWMQEEMTRVVRANCVSKEAFDAHARGDEVFQKDLLARLAEREAMSGELLDAKLENIRTHLAGVVTRVDTITRIVDRRGG